MSMHVADDMSGFRVLLPVMQKFAADLMTRLWGRSLRQYRPEKYYMRGPGPKWHEKHAPRSDISSHVQIPVMLDQKWD